MDGGFRSFLLVKIPYAAATYGHLRSLVRVKRQLGQPLSSKSGGAVRCIRTLDLGVGRKAISILTENWGKYLPPIGLGRD